MDRSMTKVKISSWIYINLKDKNLRGSFLSISVDRYLFPQKLSPELIISI